MKLLNYIKHWFVSFLLVFGAIWLFFEPIGLFFTCIQELNWRGYIVIIILSMIVTVIIYYPRKKISVILGDTGTKVSISQSDLLQQNGSIVFAVSDTYDTELGDIINPESIIGQFLTNIYNSNKAELDNDIRNALVNYEYETDNIKRYGKKERYPIGSVACISRNNSKYFLVAMNKMLSDKKRVTTNIDDLWNGLYSCWKNIRDCGNHSEVHIPVIGTKYGRTGLSHNLVIQLIITSFIMAMKEECISPALAIHIHKSDINKIDFISMKSWLKNLGEQI